jgi:hypothetical protein
MRPHPSHGYVAEDALYELDHPDEATRIVRAIPVFEPGPDEQLTPGPAMTLQG